MTAKIPVYKKNDIVAYTIVDDDLYNELNIFKWYLHNKNYVYRPSTKNEILITGKAKRISIHQQIMGFPVGFEVDHIDGNKLNNRKENLRLATRKQNEYNKPKNKNNTSGYKGVTYRKTTKDWRAMIRVDGVNTELGRFKTPEEAYFIYCKKAIEIQGEFAHKDVIDFYENNKERYKDLQYRPHKAKYRGVMFEKRTGKYYSVLKYNKKAHYLGSYDTPEEAARAYNVKAIELLGDKAKLNNI